MDDDEKVTNEEDGGNREGCGKHAVRGPLPEVLPRSLVAWDRRS